MNWFPITVTGQLRWDSYSKGLGADNDITLQLVPPETNALTSGNGDPRSLTFETRPAYILEFYAGETLRRLGAGGRSWWDALWASIGSDAEMSRLIDRRLALVTGLFGLDGVHGNAAELHPVFAMAVLIDTVRTGERLREQWAVMVRNLGNEGDCSEGKIPLTTSRDSVPGPIQDFVIDLGWWRGAGAARVRLGPSWSVDPTRPPAAGLIPGGHVYLNITHRRPAPGQADFLFLGTIYVEWTTDGAGSPLNRFETWQSAEHPSVRVDSIRFAQLTPEAREETERIKADLAGWGRLLGIEDPTPLEPVDPGEPAAIDAAWRVADRVRDPEPAIPWLVPHPVTHQCTAQTAPRLSLCFSGWRWVVAPAALSIRAGWTPFVAVYLRAHGWSVYDHLGDLGSVLGGFAYRLDLRRDRFRRRSEAPVGGRALLDGWSLSLSPIFEPVGVRLSARLTLTPYSIVSPGLSQLEGEPVKPILGTGIGLRGEMVYRRAFQEFFVEEQRYGRAGGFDSHVQVSAGLLLARPLFH